MSYNTYVPAREFRNPVRFAETRNRTPKSLSHAENFGRVLEVIGATIGKPDTFAEMRQSLAEMTANPQVTVIDGWYTKEELDTGRDWRNDPVRLRPVFLAPFSSTPADQPIPALCVRFDDIFAEDRLNIVGTADTKTIDAVTTTIGGKPLSGTTVMELSLAMVQRVGGGSAENVNMRMVQDENSPKLVLKYNNANPSEGRFAWLVVEQNGQEVPFQLSSEDARIVKEVGQYFRRVLDRDIHDRVFTARRNPRLTQGNDQKEE